LTGQREGWSFPLTAYRPGHTIRADFFGFRGEEE
jgi:hypothetical protein